MKLFFLGILVALVFLVLPFFLLYPRYLEATNLVSDGDQEITLGAYKTGIGQYTKAEAEWPLLYFDQSLKNKIENAKVEIAKRPSFTAFFRDPVNIDEVDALTDELKNTPGVRDVKYISKEDALKNYQDQNKNSPALLELVTADVLPASMQVFIDDETVKDKVVMVVKSKPIIDSVFMGADY